MTGRIAILMYAVFNNLPLFLVFGIMVLRHAVMHLAIPIWYDWLSSYVGERKGDFFSKRTFIIDIPLLVFPPICAYLVEGASDANKPLICRWVIGTAALIGIADIILHAIKVIEPPKVNRLDGSFWEKMWMPIKDRGFRQWIIILSLWHLGMYVAAPFCTPYLIGRVEDGCLGMDMLTTVFAIFILKFIGKAIGFLPMGRAIDQCGAKPVLIMGNFCWCFVPFFYGFSTPQTVFVMIGTCQILAGIFILSASSNAIEVVKLQLSHKDDKVMYLAVLAVCFTASGAIGAFIGSLIVKEWGIQTVFVWGLGARLLMFPAIFFLKMPNQKRVRDVFKMWWRALYNGKE